MAAQGITAFAATVGARPMDELVSFTRRAAKLMCQPQPGAKLCGIHSEGPFISEKRRGAMRPTGEDCTTEAVQRLLNAAQLLGLTDTMGSIEPEKCADLIICDDMLNLHTVFIDGIAITKEATI